MKFPVKLKLMNAMLRVGASALLLMLSASSMSQVEVVESRPLGGAVEIRSPVAAVPGNQQAEIFYQMQRLQQEVLQLRGLVEEQAFEIKRLKQQRMDDYLDLDRRLAALTGGDVGSRGVAPVNDGTSPSGQAESAAGGLKVAQAVNIDGQQAKVSSVSLSPEPVAIVGETESYRQAYNLLKQRQIEQAVAAFSQHLDDFPEGKYAANAQYWLGEIYLLKKELEPARQWFSQLLQSFPSHRKVADAKYKLGTVYDLLGDKVKARQLLDEVAASNESAARLAKNYIRKHF